MHFKHLVLVLTIILFTLLGWYYVLISQTQLPDSGKPNVICTTTIIADAIKNIAADTVELKVLMGPGVDPHSYKPIEQDVINIACADLIFYNGLNLEARMSDLFEKMQAQVATIAVTDSMPKEKLIYSKDFKTYPDPHVWFDPELWIYAVQTITHSLKTLNPEHATFYEQNKNAYIAQIQQMYHQTKCIMHKIPKNKRFLVTPHDAFSYFARAYDCTVVSLQGISTASEAGTRDVQNLINFIMTHKITTIFAETCIPARSMQALMQGVRAQGFEINLGHELFSDTLGSPDTTAGSYCSMIQSNVENIAQGL